MSKLTIYDANNYQKLEQHSDGGVIAAALSDLSVGFERWEAERPLTSHADQEEVIAAYRSQVDKLMTEYGFQSVDVISLKPDHPDKKALREKFLNEHTHSDHEVRFFVDGSGLFYIHDQDKVYAVLCEKGDLISVPAGATHWFDMGAQPDFKCIRLFTNPEGWVADFTGSDIAAHIPRFGE